MQYVAKTIHITDTIDVPTVIRVMSSLCSFVSVIGETEVDIRVRSCKPFNVLKDETLVVASCGVGVAVLLFLGQSGQRKLSDADVIGHLPVTLRPKSATLLKRLKARPYVFSWDESGQVKVDGKEIPDSNISDLVSDAMRARRNFNPKGAQEFFRGLSKISVPKDIARNTERWKQVQMRSPSGVEEVVFKTPQQRPPPPTSPCASPTKYLCDLLRRQTAKPKQWLPY